MESQRSRNPEVDAYIASAPEFARDILERIREAFHAGCPAIEEHIKWGVPSFEYKGLLGGMAAFKKHVTYGFWKSKLMEEFQPVGQRSTKAGMMGARVVSLRDLPPKRVLVACVREAKRLNDLGIKEPPRPRSKTPIQVLVPADLKAALATNRKAREVFDALAPSHKREYIEWITEAKRVETRVRRLATALEWMSEGKRRNWKYERS